MAEPPSSTDRRLLQVAVDHFGRLGLEGASTRSIAADAGTPMSSITYHFGGKEGLYLACADHIAAEMRGRIGPLIEVLSAPATPEEATARVVALVGGLASVMLGDDVAPVARFVVREQMSPSPAFDRLYEGVMRHVLEPLTALLAVVAGDDAPPETARLRAFTVLGQVFALRFGRAALMRAAGWWTLGPAEAATARAAVTAAARAILSDLARLRRQPTGHPP